MPEPERNFISFLDSQHNLTKARKKTYRLTITRFEGIAHKRFEDCYLDFKTIHEVLDKLDEQLEDSTWNVWLQCYQRLAKWLSDPDDEECPKVWRKIEAKEIDWDKKLKDKHFSEEEVYRLLECIDNLMDKAYVGVSVEAALRSGEALNMDIDDCKPTEYGFSITVSGKTGTRSVPIVLFAPLLRQWLNHHPLRHDKASALWIRHNGKTYKRISYSVMNSWHFKHYCERAKIYRWKIVKNKKTGEAYTINGVSLHYLRHTKVTWTAKNRKVKITTKQANLMFGWSENSPMFNRYSHLFNSDSEEAFLELAGVELKEKEEKPSLLLRKKCLNCGEQNGADALYCLKCGNPLDEEAAQRLVDLQRMQNDFLRLQPELLRLLREKAEKEAQEKGKK
jgi:integrase